MPTGGGKSLCYQLPAIIMEGVAIIISPLIALMKNQVDSIRSYAKNDHIAHFFNSTLNRDEVELVKEHVLNGTTKLLFVAPETISKEKHSIFFKKCNISFFAIDEAHCISEWGHDFRPEYRKLKTTIKNIGHKPIMALTATATKEVRKDIIKSLGIENNKLFISSFNRPNLYYEIRQQENPDKEIIKFIKQHHNKSGIIYCLSRRKAEEISELLNLNNISSLPYHAGLEQKIRKKTQDDFLMENINIIVATIAFGMGIDKPDVRFVIHYNIPKSLENYYQETGRAGRDGGEGRCILFYDLKDVEKFQNFNSKKSATEKEISKYLLQEMVSYVEDTECRRKKLLHYFNEDFSETQCEKNCDNCIVEYNSVNAQVDLLVILNAIAENENKFDLNQIILVLKGDTNATINNLNIEHLKCFKKGEHLTSKNIKKIIWKAITYDLINNDIVTNGRLTITNKGRLFLKNPAEFLINDNITLNTKQNIPTKPFDPSLVLILKKLRKKIAEKMQMPPFIIFQDPSLEDMATQYPRNQEELKNIIGVGQGKAEKYGTDFLEVIKQYIHDKQIERTEEYVVKSKAKKNDLKIFIIQNADRKTPFDAIVDQKNITIEKLILEIENIVKSGTKINIDYHIDDILDNAQQEEIYDYFLNEANNDSIEEAKEYFDEEYEESELRLMKIKLFSELAN